MKNKIVFAVGVTIPIAIVTGSVTLDGNHEEDVSRQDINQIETRLDLIQAKLQSDTPENQ